MDSCKVGNGLHFPSETRTPRISLIGGPTNNFPIIVDRVSDPEVAPQSAQILEGSVVPQETVICRVSSEKRRANYITWVVSSKRQAEITS
jgi:hypothetical protein